MEKNLPEGTFEMLFERSPDACLLIENNRFIGCNQAAVRILRASSVAQVLHMHPSDLSPEFQPDGRSSAAKADEMIALAIRNGSHRFEWTHKRADGEEFPVEVSLTLIRHGGREIVYTTWRDISERKKDEKAARDSYNLLNNIIDFLPYPTFIIDHAGVVMFWNRAMEEMTHVKARRIIGKGDYEYSLAFYGERRPILVDLVSKDKAELEKKYPRLRRDQDNERLFGETDMIPYLQRYLDGCASVLRNEAGEVLGAIEIVRDITEEKNTQQELIRAREAALSAARVKSEFLANMSHEIRTPMNAIIGLSHLMGKTELDGKQRDYLNKIRDSAQHLLGIINDILDFSKIEAGKFAVEETDFNLEEVLDHVSNVVGHAAHKKGLELLFNVQEGIPVSLRGDPLRLGQILINLANNAVKFTERGHILISVELRSKRPHKGREKGIEKGGFKFSVKDTGIGITKEQKTRLFQSFSQADASVTRKYGGTGLGLAISKKLAGLMGGDLGFRSSYGKGSTFFFTLPFGIRQETAEDHYRQMPDLRGYKVLIVDDQEVSLEVLRSYMESMGFRVTTAQSGHEALGILENSRKDPFRIIIMDWKMPGLDGFETISMMKSGGMVDSSSMIVMVSAYSAEDVKERASSLGIGGCLTKPVTQSRLLDTLMNIYGDKPGAQQAGKRIESAGAADVLLEGRRVLLVEDNMINQQVATELMESAGLKVDAASNGKEAIEMLEKGEYECVLMDIQMPVMDGFEATKIIRGIDKYKNLPVIAMTAHAMAGDRERCMEAGMNDHTPKPIDPEKFFKTLRRWLAGDKARPCAGGSEAAPAGKAQQEQAAFLPDTLPGINMAAALKLVAGNKRLLRNILLEFANSFRGAHEEVSAFIDQGRMDEACRLVHNVKGTSGNIGAHGLQQAAIELEKCLKQNKGRQTGEALRAFRDELALVIETSRTLLPAEKGPFPTSQTSGAAAAAPRLSKEETEYLRGMLGQLEDRIQQNSFDAMELFESIMRDGAKGFLNLAAGEMEALGKALNGFDFDGAMGHLQAAFEKLPPGKS